VCGGGKWAVGGVASGWQVGGFHPSQASPSSRGIAYAFAHICDINKLSQVCWPTKGVSGDEMGLTWVVLEGMV